jgi:hypothetical protein
MVYPFLLKEHWSLGRVYSIAHWGCPHGRALYPVSVHEDVCFRAEYIVTNIQQTHDEFVNWYARWYAWLPLGTVSLLV